MGEVGLDLIRMDMKTRLLAFLNGFLLFPALFLATAAWGIGGASLQIEVNGTPLIMALTGNNLRIGVQTSATDIEFFAGSTQVGEFDGTTGNLVLSAGLSSTGTAAIGSIVAGANTACNTTCTSPCMFGVNTAATEADIVDCASATADECYCLGAS